MLQKIIHFSINNKLIIALLTVGLILWGVYSVKKLPIDAVPDITNNQVQVITQSPSLATQEVERLITFPIEQTMATIPNIEQVRSISRFGLSVVTVIFHDDVDIYWARQQISEKLVEARTAIPPGIGEPEMSPISSGLGEIYQYVLHPKPGFENKFSATDMRTIQDWYVRRQLLGTPGIAEVSSFGGLLKQYEVALSPEKLRSYGISISDVFNALEKNNQNTGGAYIDKKPNAYFIRSEGLITDTASIEKIVVKTTATGMPVLIRDIATVRIGSATRYGALTRNGEGEVAGGIVMMLKGQNSNEVVARVKKKMEQIIKSLPEGVTIEAYLDRSEFVGRAIHTVTKNLIEGALIVILVLVLFLGNLRAGIVVASVIPLSMLFAISLMNLFGVSGNLMSLGAIDFGLIVDGAVIIVEATLHHIIAHKRQDHLKLTQVEMDNNVEGSAKRMMSSAAFGQIIILIVYLPILALVGIEGKMFRPMAQAVAFAILGAFLLSLTYVPMMSSLLLNKKISVKKNISDKMMDFFQRVYNPIIQGALKRRLMVVCISVGLFIASVIVFMNLGGEFLPTLDEGDFAVETRLLTGSSLNQTIEKVDQASLLLKQKFPEVKEVIGKIGSSEIPTDPMPMEACDLMVILKDPKDWTSAKSKEELIEKMSAELAKVTGVTFGFSQPIQMRFNELISGVKQDVGIKIFGDDLDVLTSLSVKIGKIVKEVSGAQDLYLEKVTGLPQIVVSIDRDQVARYGVDIESINRTISAAFAGQTAGIVYEGEKRFDLVVRLDEANRQSIEDVKNIYISGAGGMQIPLSQVSKIEYKAGPNQIQREDTKRRIVVGFNVRGRDIESVVKEIEQNIEQKIKLPPNYYITYGGQFENLKAASARLSIAVPLALGLIVLLLFFSFGSLKQAILIFSAIPMATIGGIFALVVRGMPFSISAGIGFIALFGVAVLNGIVLISEFNRLKESGLSNVFEIVLRGTAVRLRPVLMTATVASFGFLPMALATSAGAEVQKPLATVVIGGLLTSTILTLVVLPVLYTYFEKMKVKMKNVPPAATNTVILLLLILLIPAIGKSQNGMSVNGGKTSVINAESIPLPQAINTALANNPSVIASGLQVKQNQYLRKTAADFGKTELSFQYGQINSLQKDNNFSIRQPIPNPALFTASKQLSDAQIKSSMLNLDVTRSELVYQVKSIYYNLLYFTALRRYFTQQDTIFSDFLRAAQARYRAGESPLLEQASAETQLNEIRNQERKNEADIRIYERHLQTLLNTNSPYTVNMDSLILLEYTLSFSEPDSFANPIAAFNHQQITLAQGNLKVEKAKALPDFSIGYFNQSIIGFQNVGGQDVYYGGGKRFQGIQAGIQFPIFYGPYASRIKAARVQTRIAESNYDYFIASYKGQYAQALQEYAKNSSSVNYYQNSALPNAELIQRQARLAFRSGDIGYVELLQALRTYRDIQRNYLDAINDANQSIIRLLYLQGNQQ